VSPRHLFHTRHDLLRNSDGVGLFEFFAHVATSWASRSSRSPCLQCEIRDLARFFRLADTREFLCLHNEIAGFPPSPALSDAASTFHWGMSDVSSPQTREASGRARLRMLRYGTHGCVLAASPDEAAEPTRNWRPLEREMRPRLELAVGFNEGAKHLGNELSWLDRIAVDLLVVARIIRKRGIQVAADRDTHLHRTKRLGDAGEFHNHLQN
jgi:hypothetical protein